MTKFMVIIIVLCVTLQATTLSDTCKQETWVTNGVVGATAPAGDKVYIGGSFSYVGPYTGNGVLIDSSTGATIQAYPKINGEIDAVCMDGKGGWFIGGFFTSVDGVIRNKIAHILPNRSLDLAWNPDVGGSFTEAIAIYSIAVSGNTVYAGGYFTSIGGQNRNYIAALDAETGNATDWNPNANERVYSVAISGTTVYAGGDFTSIGGQNRNSIAALDAISGNAMDWNPNATESHGANVGSIIVNGTTVYVGGFFDSIGGKRRTSIAALDATTGIATNWNPNPNGTTGGARMSSISSLAISGLTVYVGGDFTNIGGQSRNSIAALDVTTGDATDWNPNARGATTSIIYALGVSGTTIYAGGLFDSIGGQSRNFIAALDAATGKATDWNPNMSGEVLSLTVNGAIVHAGGMFISAGGQNRNNIAALNMMTGNATDWNPNASGNPGATLRVSIASLIVCGTKVYVGGGFTIIGGQNRNSIAALDATTGNATDWNPNPTSFFGRNVGTVSSIAVSGTKIFVGGRFDSIGGQSRNGIAALDTITGNATEWNPNATTKDRYGTSVAGEVHSLTLSGTTVYAGGGFDSIGGQNRNRIAALDAITGKATEWNPNATGANGSNVYSLVVSGTTVYVGGLFDKIGGQSRNNLAALNISTGNATDWNPDPSGSTGGVTNVMDDISSLTVSGTTVYVCGSFTNIGGQNRYAIAAIDAITGNATEWNPISGDYKYSSTYALATSGTGIYVSGGAYTNLGKGISHPFFAQFDSIPNLSGEVHLISQSFGLNNYAISIHKYSICYTLPKPEGVSLRLYNIKGQLITELVNKQQQAGFHEVIIRSSKLSSGSYIVVFKTGDYHQEKIFFLNK